MSNVTIDEIISSVAWGFQVARGEILKKKPGRGRHALEISRARIAAIYLIKRHTMATPRNILEAFGRPSDTNFRDFVKYADEICRERLSFEMDFRRIVERCEANIDRIHERRSEYPVTDMADHHSEAEGMAA